MISIIVISYNARHHLEHCLTRLAEQLDCKLQAGEIEMIVADNASSDGSPELVRDRFPSCRLLELPQNLGFGRANNRAADLARGESLLLLNSDAWLANDALEILSSALDNRPRLALVAPRLRYPDGRLQFSWVPETGVVGEAIQKLRNPFENARWNHQLLPRLWRSAVGPGWYSAACVLLRRRAFAEVGGFDENIFMYFEDVDLCHRLHLAGWHMELRDRAEAFHVKGGSQLSDFGEVEYRRGQLYYYRKHRPAWENRMLRRRLRRNFERVPRPELRESLLKLLEAAVQDSDI